MSPSYMPCRSNSRRKSGSNAMINADLAELYKKPAPQPQSNHSKYQSNNQGTNVKSSAKYSTDTQPVKPQTAQKAAMLIRPHNIEIHELKKVVVEKRLTTEQKRMEESRLTTEQSSLVTHGMGHVGSLVHRDPNTTGYHSGSY